MTVAPASPRLAISKILFTTDFSSASQSALPYALAFAGWFGAKIFLAHAIPSEPRLTVPLDVLPREDNPYWQGAQRKLDEFLSTDPLKQADYEVLLEQGDLWEVLDHIICRQQIDFIVLGTHGRQGLKKLVLGSAAEQVFRLAPCPVLTVGPKAVHPAVEFETFKSILFATDFSPASLHALPYALSLAQENQARLTLFHAVALVPMQQREMVESENLAKLEALLPPDADLWCKPRLLVNFEFPTDGILRVAQQYDADLIVMGVHKTATPRASAHLPWAIAYDVVCGAHCPVLTVRG
jgi:nucleotide-binding universal stress UspA family protein